MLLRNPRREPVDIDFTLRRVFGKKSFRPLQREVIQAVIDGHDVFLQAATSFGKSLCFQLPAVVGRGVTVVVSPLLALMADQVAALEANGVPVATINSTTPQSKKRAIITDLLSGHPFTRLLYVTPEYCQTDNFRRHLQTIHMQGELRRVAIDEAHCVSEWGHDFRPAYKELSWFRRELKNPQVPITALTATATPRVRADIISLLGLDNSTLKKFHTPSARPNIHYEVRYLTDFACDPTVPESSQIDDFLDWLKSVHDRRMARLSRHQNEGPENQNPSQAPLRPVYGIVYVPLRSICSELANDLCAAPLNIKAVAYHAGLPAAERAKVQAAWSSAGKTPSITTKNGEKAEPPPKFYLVVATNAFGMGIDNPHVRFVVHWTPPRSFEGFVQESGRAGRDGKAAVSLVYYNPQERERVIDRIRRDQDGMLDTTTVGINLVGKKRSHSMMENANGKIRNRQAMLESFEKVVKYCEDTSRCRHEAIKEFSGELEMEREQKREEQRHRQQEQQNNDDKNQSVPPRGTKRPHQTAPHPSTATTTSSVCDFACDFCKEGKAALTKRKAAMVAESAPEDYYDAYARPPFFDWMGL